MTNRRLAPGQAPPIGLENEKRARENLQAKLSLIQAWITGVLETSSVECKNLRLPLAELPKSQRAFNAWTSSNLPESVLRTHGPFYKNANSTLVKNGPILQQLRAYLEILKQSDKNDPTFVKRENVASLHRRITMEKALRGIAERELVRARAKSWIANEELKALQAKFESTEAYAAERISQLETLLKQVTAERAELAHSLSKVVGMRPVKK